MSIEIVADKYSSAMFELAQEQNKLDLMEEQLGYVASVMDEQPELSSFLENPTVTEDRKARRDKPIILAAGDHSCPNSVPGVPINSVISEM